MLRSIFIFLIVGMPLLGMEGDVSSRLKSYLKQRRTNSSANSSEPEITDDYILSLKSKVPIYPPSSGLSYYMTKEEIKTHLYKLLVDLRKKGQLLTKSEFQKSNIDNWYPQGNNVTRVWGAEFLKKKLKNKLTVDAAKHIIVVEDLKDITLSVQLYNTFFPEAIEVEGDVYGENIKGTVLGLRDHYFTLKQLKEECLGECGFTDYSENIVHGYPAGEKDARAKYYVVDTEAKSFHDATVSRFYSRDNTLWDTTDILKKCGSQLNFFAALQKYFKETNTCVNDCTISVKISLPENDPE